MFPKIVGFPPKSSILIGFSIIFTIHFGAKPTTIFGETPTQNPSFGTPGIFSTAKKSFLPQELEIFVRSQRCAGGFGKFFFPNFHDGEK